MLSFSDHEMKIVMAEAATLPPDKRSLFLERIEVVMWFRRCDVRTAIHEAMAGLSHTARKTKPAQKTDIAQVSEPDGKPQQRSDDRTIRAIIS